MGWVVWAFIKLLYKIFELKSRSGYKEKWGRNTTIRDTMSQLSDVWAALLLQKCECKSSAVLWSIGPSDPSDSPWWKYCLCSNSQGCSRKLLLEVCAIHNSLWVKRMLWVAQASVWGLQGATATVWQPWRAAELPPVFLQNINQLAFHSFNSTSLTNGYTQWFPHFPKMCPHCLLKWFAQFCPSTADFGSLLWISTTVVYKNFAWPAF